MKYYFEYPVTNYVVNFKPDWIKLPALTACLYHDITREKAETATSRSFKGMNYVESRINLTLREFVLISANYSDLFIECVLNEGSGKERK